MFCAGVLVFVLMLTLGVYYSYYYILYYYYIIIHILLYIYYYILLYYTIIHYIISSSSLPFLSSLLIYSSLPLSSPSLPNLSPSQYSHPQPSDLSSSSSHPFLSSNLLLSSSFLPNLPPLIISFILYLSRVSYSYLYSELVFERLSDDWC